MTDSTPGGGTGHCLCGAVQYRYEGEPITIGLCQCDRCQTQSGSAFLISVGAGALSLDASFAPENSGRSSGA